MVDGIEAFPNNVLDLRVALDVRARECLGAQHERRHGVRLPERAHALVARDRDLDVGGVGQPVRVDDGRDGRIGRGEAQVAARPRRAERDGQRGVIVAVVRVAGDEILLVAQVRAQREVFQLRPVGGVRGQLGQRLVGQGGAERLGHLFPCQHVRCWVRIEARRVVIEGLGCRGGCRGVGQRGERDAVDAIGRAEIDVVLHVLTDSRPVGDDWDPQRMESRSGTDSGSQQQLWRAEYTRSHDDFLRGEQGVSTTLSVHRYPGDHFIFVKENLLRQCHRVDFVVGIA